MKQGSRFGRRARRHVTFANVAATLALFVSLTGTAWAALITTAQIKDSAITSPKIKNYTIALADLSAGAKSGLKGVKGDTGPAGDQGDPGAPADIDSSFSYLENSRYVSLIDDPPNPGALDWNDPAYNSGNEDTGVARISLNAADLASAGVTTVLGLDRDTNDGYLSVNYDSNINGVAAFTLMHKGTTHTRAECQMFLHDQSSGTDYTMGEATYVSSNIDREMVPVTLVGSKNGSASAGSPKIYNVYVVCRDADWDSLTANQWEFVRGNLVAYAASR